MRFSASGDPGWRAAELGIDEVLAEMLPADKAAKVAELQGQGRNIAMGRRRGQ